MSAVDPTMSVKSKVTKPLRCLRSGSRGLKAKLLVPDSAIRLSRCYQATLEGEGETVMWESQKTFGCEDSLIAVGIQQAVKSEADRVAETFTPSELCRRNG